MRTKFNGVLTLLLALFVQISFAQDRTISGNVSDDTGPLPGVTILKKGTTQGTETDFDGNYTIQAKTGDILVFSFVGMKTAERAVAGSNQINVILENDNLLEEVIVVAYGTTTKEAFTGSAQVISVDDIASRPATSPVAAIEGKVTGVQFTSANGAPGSSPGILIRGAGTLNGSTSPLYIVDGVQFDGALSLINQDDIESMTILKDAASAALYGPRAANGVVIITTKSGKQGKLKVGINSQLGVISNAIPNYNTVNPGQYYELMWESYKNTLSGPDVEGQASAGIYSQLGYNPFNVPNDQIVGTDGKLNPNAQFVYQSADWRDAMEKTGIRTNHSINVSGGGEKHHLFFSSSYLDEEGYVINTNFNRVTTRLNADFQLADWVKIGSNINLATTKTNGDLSGGTSSIVNPFNWAIDLAPIYPVYMEDQNGNFVLDSNGNKQFDRGVGNPAYNQLARPYNPDRHGIQELVLNKDIAKQNNYGFKNFVDFKLLDGLNFKVDYSLQFQDYISKNYENHIIGDGAPGGRFQETRYRRTIENINQILSYNKTLDDVHNLELTLGHESMQRNYSQLYGIANTQTATGIYEFANFSAGDNVDGYSSDYRLEGYFSRLNYNFDNKYFLSGSFRRDATSVFSKQARTGYFYSVGAGWIISKENFMKDVSFVNNLKLRGSYGEVGNDNLLNSDGSRDYYIYQALYTIHPNAGTPGIVWTSTGNELLEWENQASWDVALDFTLFNYTIDGAIEYFNKETKGLLFNLPIPLSEGLNQAPQNIGDMVNKGWEVSLNAHLFKNNNFKWDLGLQGTHLENEITSIPSPSIQGTKRWAEGHSRYDYFLYHYAGVDPNNGDALYYMYEPDATTGEQVPVLNADGTHATTNDFQDAQRAYTGDSSIPDLIGSVSNSFSYKGLSLDFLFTFGIGGKVLDRGYAQLMHEGTYGQNLHVDALNAWRNPGDVTNVPRLENGNNDLSVQNSTRFLTDASYLALKNINLSYSLKSHLSDKLGVNDLRFFMSAENLFLLTKREGLNPQYSLSGVQDGNDYSPARVLSFGVNLTF
ncbi:SusC/RagA family TonB-linked outer membrane protein [Tenacibaculum caenipelagi]|uniref:TonB-linked SusC/RagA family outer membrane protein n=1 Tax=Tenacibaculum caenipelagi TaxID=1325435 RepID=A0A4R6TKJ0_9FLAO|nr:TonB-dependent receptor [Tenacibaculum caenipelagi]TDQ30048.1 TonB-linked SusC/RagA family outer membrane protein [Tenacibaculum caenipelagi]